jgi:hypothetical protein
MLKLNTSYSKKVPAESDYSSKSYHASIEAELPDGLTDQQLRDRIHGAFELVKASVESEIGSQAPRQAPRQQHSAPPAHIDCASSKQLKYLLDLGRQHGMTPGDLAAKAGARNIDSLTRQQCSKLIDELGRKAA